MAAILLLAILAIGASVQATQIIDDEPMPYDMSAVEEMERIEAAEVAHVNSHQPTQDQDQEQQGQPTDNNALHLTRNTITNMH